MLTEHLLKALAQEAMQQEPFPNPLFPPSPYYRFFRVLAKELQPKLSVVLGVCGGGDCLHLALGCSTGTVLGIDNTADHPEQIEFIKKRCPNFIYYVGDSVKSAKLVNRAFGLVDILFIDTIHTKERTWEEYRAWEPFLAPTSIVCFDDLFRQEMGNFWEEVPEPKLRIDNLHDGAESGGGFGMTWKA